MSSHYPTTRARHHNRSSDWQDTISRTFVPCVTTLPSNFRGAVSANEIGLISCHRVQATKHHAARTAADISTHHKDVVLLNLISSGRARVVQDGRIAVLGKGDFAIHDATRPYSLYFDTAFSQLIFQIPRHLLKQRLGAFERYTAVRLSSDEQIGHLTSNFLLNLSRFDNDLDPIMAERFTAQTADLVAMTLGAQLGAVAASRSSHRSALLYRAKSFIETRLHAVTTAEIAEALGCSTRYVNDLFTDEETTVGNYVLFRRLERCREDLADPTQLRRISEIAYAWGFNSIAHFSRVFRGRYDMSPSEYREQHAAKRRR